MSLRAACLIALSVSDGSLQSAVAEVAEVVEVVGKVKAFASLRVANSLSSCREERTLAGQKAVNQAVIILIELHCNLHISIINLA